MGIILFGKIYLPFSQQGKKKEPKSKSRKTSSDNSADINQESPAKSPPDNNSSELPQSSKTPTKEKSSPNIGEMSSKDEATPSKDNLQDTDELPNSNDSDSIIDSSLVENSAVTSNNGQILRGDNSATVINETMDSSMATELSPPDQTVDATLSLNTSCEVDIKDFNSILGANISAGLHDTVVLDDTMEDDSLPSLQVEKTPDRPKLGVLRIKNMCELISTPARDDSPVASASSPEIVEKKETGRSTLMSLFRTKGKETSDDTKPSVDKPSTAAVTNGTAAASEPKLAAASDDSTDKKKKKKNFNFSDYHDKVKGKDTNEYEEEDSASEVEESEVDEEDEEEDTPSSTDEDELAANILASSAEESGEYWSPV